MSEDKTMSGENVMTANQEVPVVHIVGAGPGDPELITRKGYRLVSEADIVIYAGSLVNPEIFKSL